MTEDEERAAVLQEAYTWIGTPYHHKARVKGHGVDCALYLAEVYHAAIPHKVCEVRPPSYPRDWHLHNDDTSYLDWVRRFAVELPEGETPKPGDVVMYRFGRAVAHGGIVVDWPNTIIHSYLDSGVVEQEPMEEWLEKRRHSFWTMWPKGDN